MKVFDDRLYLWNPGGLPGGLTIEKLAETHNSVRRNPLIANVCYLGGYIEQFGSGTQKIFSSCREAGLPRPLFEEIQSGLSVTLYQDKYNEPRLRSDGLSDRQIKVIKHMKQHGRIANKDYQALNDISRETASRDLAELVESGYIKQMGQKAGTHYVLA